MTGSRDRAVGALVGLAVGDAVGTTLEFKRPGTFEPITDMAKLVRQGRLPQGPRVGILSISGGSSIVYADRALEMGLTLPPFEPATLEAMVAAGITEIGVIVGDTRDEVMAALGDGGRFGASITFIPQDAPLGLAHCVLIAREFLADLR